MSFRGGRGGPGGRGGYGGPGGVNGFGSSFGDLNPDFTPTELYPKTILPIQSSLQARERRSAAQFIEFTNDVRDGPLYTGQLVSSSTDTKKATIMVEIDLPKDGIRRYSDRYMKKRKIGRSIDEHPYHLPFFPVELYSVMGVKGVNSDNKVKKTKRLDITKFTTELLRTELLGGDDDDVDVAELKRAGLQALKALDDPNGPTGQGASKEDENEDNEPEDDDEVDDMDDMDDEDDDDDYNAEKYFDDGEGMDDDDGNDEAAY
ncbi:III, C31 subunit of DNA-directed RNA polymerase [Nadsonia fulvescens var. elongata DSM 6958]|uniref:DNA-directed RNA polymerase III subunit n=1 Tax=Nadsonia fulvescens var. elongata DSM 6958 TaxID=857566 RepID=A0A1E3PGF5_9ASCO|nr:III, C31 subunit of DNA-directed RNA polymerase [Nadsonia fulvescens var. elongata DSM 6958]